jgi:hypothetical protein
MAVRRQEAEPPPSNPYQVRRRTERLMHPGSDLLADLEAGCRVLVPGYRVGRPRFVSVHRDGTVVPADRSDWPR